MFNDNARTGIILVGIAIVVCAACVVLYLIKSRNPRQTVESADPRKVALNIAQLKVQLGEAERALAWNKKQLDMVRFWGSADSATEAGFVSAIARLEESVRRISAES